VDRASKHWRLCGGLLVGLLLVCGCARQKTQIGALTDTQEVFYEIQELYQSGEAEMLIARATIFLTTAPPPELERPILYYLARRLDQRGKFDLARQRYRELLLKYPETDWAKLAEVGLRTMKG